MQKSPEGQSICLGDISRDQCCRLTGARKKPVKGLAGQCQFDATEQEGIDACRLDGGDWGRHGAYVYYCLNTKLKEACLKKGGSWTPYSHGENVCVLKTGDAGKVCRDAKDC